MKYTIKEIEGVDNFIKTYSLLEGRDRRDMYVGTEDLFKNGLIVKEGLLKDGDEISVELTEFTSYTRQEIKTVTGFKVVQHDSFLLKLVKVN